jgi:hypothetical protein
MPGNQGSPGENVINITIAIHVKEIWPLPTINEKWLSTHGAESAYRRIHPARE